MEFKNTIQSLQKLGGSIIKEGRGILKQKKKQTKANTLYNDFDYLVTSSKDSVTLEFEFGNADDYWQFVDEGVRGAGGYKGSGKMRGGKTKFRFGSGKGRGNWQDFKMSIKRWISNKPLRLRGKSGRFASKTETNINSAVFLIQRAIYQRGLERTQFFSKPYTQQFKKQENKILEAFANDVENELQKTLNKN